jgi:branched-chain amino acid transport system substrate-binding protein
MMNRNCLFFLLALGVFTLCACAPSMVSRGEPPGEETPADRQAMKRFEEAERLSEAGAFLESVAIYEEYLSAYPKGNLAEKALMSSGLVLMAAGQYEQARGVFDRLLEQFPRSLFSEDARYNIVLAFYTEGDYPSAVASGKSALQSVKTPGESYRIYNLLGYAFGAVGDFLKAFESYMNAYEQGGPDKQPEILNKVKDVIAHLNENEVNDLLEQYGAREPGGYLRLQLAKIYAAEDLIEAAMAVLYEFEDLFPNHEERATVDAMLAELQSRARVDRYLIGCILPLTGRYATFGNRALTGIELAVEEMNTDPDHSPVQLLIRDSKSEPAEAVSALDELVLDEGVVAVVGPMVTSESVANRAQSLKVPVITLTQKPDITAIGDYVFRDFLTVALQVKAVVEYAVQDLGIRKVAIFYPAEPYGVNFMNRFWEELSQHGAEVVGVESYTPDQTDFRDAIKKLVGLYYPRVEHDFGMNLFEENETWNKLLDVHEREMDWTAPQGSRDDTEPVEEAGLHEDTGEPAPIVDFEAVFIPDSFDKVVLIAPQLIYYNVTDVLLLGTNLWHAAGLLETAGHYVEGAIIPDGFFVDSPSVRVQEFVESYQSMFGESPGYLEAQAYDVARFLFEAVNRPEVKSRLTLLSALKNMAGFKGVTGTTFFNETGEAEKDIYLLTVEKGRFVQIKP